MLECNDVRLLLADYEASNLPEEQAQQVAEHLLLCPICAAELETLRRENDRFAEAAPSPAAPRTLGTQAPASVETPVPAEETEEPEVQVPVTGQTTELAPRRKLRRRGKVLIGLAVLLVLVGICAGVLYHFEAFAIRDWAKSKDGKYIALIYKGDAPGAEGGFRVRIGRPGEKEWVSEARFRGHTCVETVWSPDGRWLAVEYIDTDGIGGVYVMDTQSNKPGPVAVVLDIYSGLSKLPLALQGKPISLGVLQWLPDSSALLISGTITVPQEEVDPDYGVMPLDPLGNDQAAPAAESVAGYFVYQPETQQIKSHGGFSWTADQQQRNVVVSNLMSWCRTQGYDSALQMMFYYGESGFRELAVCMQANVPLQILRYQGTEYPMAEWFVPASGSHFDAAAEGGGNDPACTQGQKRIGGAFAGVFAAVLA